MKTKFPHIVPPADATYPQPPPNLQEEGRALWHRIQAEYAVDDVSGCEYLAQACAMADRAAELAAAVARDGATIYVRNVPRSHPSIREELGCRAFIVRTLARLGIGYEPVKTLGRPPKV